jgi:hypothetical protein
VCEWAQPPIRLELTLELEQGADPPSGRLLTAGGGELEFAGWLGFALALERLIEGAATAPPPERGGSR